MHSLANKRKINTFEALMNYLNLFNWKNYKLNPTSGVFHYFKNYINVKWKLENIKEKENESEIFSLNDLIAKYSPLDNHFNTNTNNNLENSIEKILNRLYIDKIPVEELIIKWCMENLDKLDSHFKKIRVNLFTEYNVNYLECLSKKKNKNIFHIGNFSHKMLALHELIEFDRTKYSGIVLTFEKNALFGSLW
jgi:hypothetical protein